MNTTQHKSAERLADLSPFDVKVTVETPKAAPRVRNAACCEFREGGTETDEGYGCVEWYHYPGTRAGGAGAAR